MKKTFCAILSSLVIFTLVLVTPVHVHANPVIGLSALDGIAMAVGVTSLVDRAQQAGTTLQQYRDSINELRRQWQTSYQLSIEVDPDDLWECMSSLNSSGFTCQIYQLSTNMYVIRGYGLNSYRVVPPTYWADLTTSEQNVPIAGRYFCVPYGSSESGATYDTHVLVYATHYPSSYILSSINMRMTSFSNDVISKLNQILNALPSTINYTSVLNNIDARLNTFGGYVDQIEAKQDVGNGLLNNIDQRLNTIGGYVDQIEVKLDNLHNDLVSISGQLSSIINLLRGSNPLGDQLFVIPMSSPISDVRYIPYDTMVQLCADIISNHNLQEVTVIESGATTGYLIDSASMTRSFLVEENDYYSLIVRYSLAGFGGSLEETGRLCDVNGHPYRSFQQDNYLFRIYNKVDQIYNWLDNADLLTGEDIETMISNTNSKVLQFLPFSNNFIQMVNNVFPASPSLDWAGMNNYLQTVGRDAE